MNTCVIHTNGESEVKTITMPYEEYRRELDALNKKNEAMTFQVECLRDCLRDLVAWNADEHKPLSDDYAAMGPEGVVKYVCDSVTDTIGW